VDNLSKNSENLRVWVTLICWITMECPCCHKPGVSSMWAICSREGFCAACEWYILGIL